MKVIARDNKEETYEAKCPACGCTIEYTEEDLEDLDHGTGFYCPDCGEAIYQEQFKKYEFPKAFYHFGGHDFSVAIDDKTTQKYINRVVDSLNEHEIGDYTFVGSGDTIVIGLKNEDEDMIIVAKNYWEEDISR